MPFLTKFLKFIIFH